MNSVALLSWLAGQVSEVQSSRLINPFYILDVSESYLENKTCKMWCVYNPTIMCSKDHHENALQII